MRRYFDTFARKAAAASGSYWAFIVALQIIVVWALIGPLFGFSNTWQLVINTVTSIVTFVMVFLIQHTQNRDTRALHLKLDELLRAVEGAREDVFIDLEQQEDRVVKDVQQALRAQCATCSSPEQHARHTSGTRV